MEIQFMIIVMLMVSSLFVDAKDTNNVYTPCSDTTVQRSDGFSFGIAFASKESFFFNKTQQLSPCDSRLSLSSASSRIALFRPKVDEISILSVNDTSFSPDSYGGYMVAFAGRKYAARSPPTFVANSSSTYIVTSFTLVLEFQKGTLVNLYWKNDGCKSCSGSSNYTCINNEACALPINKCISRGGTVDCSLGIQLAFSGTDKNLDVLNSWYEVEKLQQYSLYNVFSDLKNSLTSQYSNIL